MRKKNFLFIVAMVFILMLSGCGKSSTSEPITTTKFKTIMEEKGLEVTDKTDSAKDHSYQEIYVAEASHKLPGQIFHIIIKIFIFVIVCILYTIH